nr:serine/threonine protein kinase [Quadrisphaera sp. RL12-1S]
MRSGGFADVHLYQQHRPSRPVAVKVLKTGSADPSHFDDEADRIAQLGEHPYVVTIHAVAVAADGRPYLVMEYCSGGTLGDRCRGGQMSVPEVLDVAVKLSSAVHAVHQASLLHRDIKPANVLLVGADPRLTDFGISAPLAEGALPTGLSLPWAAPEQFVEGGAADARTEVWSLGATLHALLTGRSPFSLQGSSELAHIARIQSAPRPSTGRRDVPPSLERLLDRALSKDPRRRQASAQEVVLGLQAVQAELGLPVTPVPQAPAPSPGAPVVVHDDGGGEPTRLRPLRLLEPRPADPTVRRSSVITAVPSSSTGPHTGQLPDQLTSGPADRLGDAVDPSPDTGSAGLTATVLRPPARPSLEADPTPAPGRSRTALVVAAAAVVVGLGLVAAAGVLVVQLTGAGATASGPAADPTAPAQDLGPTFVEQVEAPTALTFVPAADGSVQVGWTAPPGSDASTAYLVGLLSDGGVVREDRVAGSATVLPAGGPRCVQVRTVLGDGRTSDDAVKGCAP